MLQMNKSRSHDTARWILIGTFDQWGLGAESAEVLGGCALQAYAVTLLPFFGMYPYGTPNINHIVSFFIRTCHAIMTVRITATTMSNEICQGSKLARFCRRGYFGLSQE